jgi:hypothetical protein
MVSGLPRYRACAAHSDTAANLRSSVAPMSDSRSIARRTFFQHAARVLGGAVAAQPWVPAIVWNPKLHRPMTLPRAGERTGAALRIAVVTTRDGPSPPTGGSSGATMDMGVHLGMDEAARAATLLGGTVSLLGPATNLRDALSLIAGRAAAVVICSASDNETAELGEAATEKAVLLLNARAGADALRNERCARLVFHIAPSDKMRDDARRLWSVEGDRGSTGAADVTAWDPHLERFGAAQLNARFEARFRRPMSSAAWAGWFAVKVAWEASQRARSTEARAIAQYLERDGTQFDGQKGVPLSFRRWDHQLRQPLYVSSSAGSADSTHVASGTPSPIPAPDATPARAALDALGTTEEASACRWR